MLSLTDKVASPVQARSLKYLMPSDPSVYVDLTDDADVKEMLDDWREAAAANPAGQTPARLQVFICPALPRPPRPPTHTHTQLVFVAVLVGRLLRLCGCDLQAKRFVLSRQYKFHQRSTTTCRQKLPVVLPAKAAVKLLKGPSFATAPRAVNR